MIRRNRMRFTTTMAAAIVLCSSFIPLASRPSAALAGEAPVTNVIGGTTAPPDAYPWMIGIIEKGENTRDGFRCGGTVLSRSWILTAAHCVVDWDGYYPDSTYGHWIPASSIEVLTGTSSLLSGGQRMKVASIHPHPYYRVNANDHDVALIRLARPTSVPEVSIIGTSAEELQLDDASNIATAAGWGVTSLGSGTPASSLRHVNVPVLSSSTCASSYPLGFSDEAGPLEYHGSNMLCAGYVSGGKDTCYGDSGGPLVVQAPDTSWRQIGVTSFGFLCGEPGYPGVYHRLSSSASWVGLTRRFGPFAPDVNSYITQNFRDFLGRNPTASEMAQWKNTLSTNPASTIGVSLTASPQWDSNAAMNIRLFSAAFLRDPDSGGLNYWVNQRWAGRGAVSIANHFASSSEFIARYGTLSNTQYVDQIYLNIFGRSADSGGRAYWTQKLDNGAGRGLVLYELSDSSEYRRNTDTRVRVISTWFGFLRRTPSQAEITANQSLNSRSLVDLLRNSYRYAARFNS